MFFCKRSILFQPRNRLFYPGDCCRVIFDDFVLQLIFFGKIIRLQKAQLLHLNIQVHFLLDVRVICRKHFDLRIGKSSSVHIFTGTHGRFARHNLTCELLLALNELPAVCVKSAFSNISVQTDLWVFVALPHRSSGSLLQIGRSPRTVKVVGSNDLVLHIRPRTHFLCTAHQDSHFATAYLFEQLLLLCFGIRLVDKLNFRFGNTTLDQLLSYVRVDGKFACALWSGEVAK